MSIIRSSTKYAERELIKHSVKAFRFYKNNLLDDEIEKMPWETIKINAQWNDIKIEIVQSIINEVGIDAVLATSWYSKGKTYPQLINQAQYDALSGEEKYKGKNKYREIGEFEGNNYYLAIFAGAGELMLKTIRLISDLGYIIEFDCED